MVHLGTCRWKNVLLRPCAVLLYWFSSSAHLTSVTITLGTSVEFAGLGVTVGFAGCVFAGRGDRFQTRAVYDKQSQQYILMPFDSRASSVGLEIFLLTSAELSNALCQCERQFKRQAGEAVIQSEVLRISPGSSSFSNYPPAGILAALDNNGCPGVRLSPLKCGWRAPTWGAGTGKCLLFLLCHLRSTTPEPNVCAHVDFRKTLHPSSYVWCDNQTCSLKVLMCFRIQRNYQMWGMCLVINKSVKRHC